MTPNCRASERTPQDRTTQNNPTAADIPISNATNGRGRFQFYAAPGRYVLIPETRPLGSRFNPQELPTLIKNGAKEFEVKDEKDIELNVNLVGPVCRTGSLSIKTVVPAQCRKEERWRARIRKIEQRRALV